MKTYLLRHSFMALLLTGILASCQDDTLSLKENGSVLKYAELKSNKEEIKLPESDTLYHYIPVTKEMEANVIEAVKPVQEIIGKILQEDKTGIFERYKKDVEQFNSLKELKEKTVHAKKMQDEYFDFFTAIWKKADIDEAYYQLRIREAFPKEMQDGIEFKEFLNFTTHVKKHTRDRMPPPRPTLPADICIDATTTWFGIKVFDPTGLAQANGFADAHLAYAAADAQLAGLGKATVGIASNITIPGTFPDDYRKLRVKKEFNWSGYTFALATIGCSFGSVQYTTVMNTEFIRVWAPVIFINMTEFDVHRSEDYLIKKQFLYNIRYGVSVYADSFSEIIAISNSNSTVHTFSWNVCEETNND